MSILKQNLNPEETRADKAVNMAIIFSQSAFSETQRCYELMANHIWNHQTLTAAEVLSALGTSAGEYMSIVEKLKTAGNGIKANSLIVSKEKAYTTASDGTVTID
jgi:hypothetical protein